MKLPWGLRWWELLPEIVVALALGLFLITETSAATSAFKSGTAIKLMALAGAAWFVGRLVLVRYTRWPALRLAVFAAAAAVVVVVVVLPAYDDNTVVEALPVAPAGTGPAASTTTASSAPVPPPVAPSVTLPTAAASSTTTTPPAIVPPPAPPPPTTTPPVPPAPPTAPPQPVAVRSSAIHGIDHRARGTAVIYRQPDASLVIGLERIDIQPGPDYDVYVVPGAGRERIAGGTRLDDLRGNKGTQFYPVPTGTDVTAGRWTVLVWCQTFDVPVAGATPV